MIKKLFLLTCLLMMILPVAAQNDEITRIDLETITGRSRLSGHQLSPDGMKVAAAGGREGLCIIEIDTEMMDCHSFADFGQATSTKFVQWAPDNQHIAAAFPTGLCIFSLETETIACDSFPENHNLTTIQDFVWSPDSTQLAFTQDYFAGGIERPDPDMWVYDVVTRTFNNYGEDNVDTVEFDDEALIDLYPTWNPFDNRLYFLRLNREMFGNPVFIEFISPGSPESELLIPLGGDFFAGMLPWVKPTFTIDPFNRTRMVLTIGGGIDTNRGIWLINTESGGARHIEHPAIFPGIPQDYSEDMYMAHAMPTGEDGFLVSVFTEFAPFTLYYTVDFDGEITPLLDLSAMTIAELSDVVEPVSGLSYQDFLPEFMLLSADMSRVYLATDAGLYSMTLPPDENSLRLELTDTYNWAGKNRRGLQHIPAHGRILVEGRYILEIPQN